MGSTQTIVGIDIVGKALYQAFVGGDRFPPATLHG
jgi:hypothetical protein